MKRLQALRWKLDFPSRRQIFIGVRLLQEGENEEGVKSDTIKKESKGGSIGEQEEER